MSLNLAKMEGDRDSPPLVPRGPPPKPSATVSALAAAVAFPAVIFLVRAFLFTHLSEVDPARHLRLPQQQQGVPLLLTTGALPALLEPAQPHPAGTAGHPPAPPAVLCGAAEVGLPGVDRCGALATSTRGVDAGDCSRRTPDGAAVFPVLFTGTSGNLAEATLDWFRLSKVVMARDTAAPSKVRATAGSGAVWVRKKRVL